MLKEELNLMCKELEEKYIEWDKLTEELANKA